VSPTGFEPSYRLIVLLRFQLQSAQRLSGATSF
jgi:hypothetical protein